MQKSNHICLSYTTTTDTNTSTIVTSNSNSNSNLNSTNDDKDGEVDFGRNGRRRKGFSREQIQLATVDCNSYEFMHANFHEIRL